MKDFHQRMDAIERRILKRLRENQTERNDYLRARVVEEIAQFVLNEPIHSWVPSILAERIRALAAQPDPHKERGK
jgi:hypothetical protein